MTIPKHPMMIYKANNGQIVVDVRLESDTVWLSLNQIAQLFGRDKSVISKHLSKIFKEGELDRSSTVAFFAIVQTEGERSVEKIR